MKFLDDICVAYAWSFINGSLDELSLYLAKLKYNTEEQFPEGRYPTPLEALDIPSNVLEDRNVDALALRLFNSTRTFVLAHQLGHLYHNHVNYDLASNGSRSIEAELEADTFALDILQETSTIPMGLVIYFFAATHLRPNATDFQDHADWMRYTQEKAIHPLTQERMKAISKYLQETFQDDGEGEANARGPGEAVVRYIADQIAMIAAAFEDEGMQRGIAVEATAERDVVGLPYSLDILESPLTLGSGDEVEDASLGTITYHVPRRMQLGETWEIHVVLEPLRPGREVRTKVPTRGELKSHQVRMSDRMEMSLSGRGLQIVEITPEVQAVARNGVTEWKWNVEPSRPGVQLLQLTTNIIASVKGADLPRTIFTSSEKIRVDSSWVRRVGNFVVGNWQWLWAAIVIPVLTWFWNYGWGRRKRKEEL